MCLTGEHVTPAAAVTTVTINNVIAHAHAQAALQAGGERVLLRARALSVDLREAQLQRRREVRMRPGAAATPEGLDLDLVAPCSCCDRFLVVCNRFSQWKQNNVYVNIC